MTEAPAWLRYSNQSATRNDPLDPRLVETMSFLPELGVTMEVFSGGQEAAGEGGSRTGSTRHDHGGAGDVFFYKDGRRLDWANPDDLPLFTEIIKRGRQRGLTGIGAGDGYMQPGSMHIGFGSESVWGAGGKGSNAPEWLKSAFWGTKPGPGHSVEDGHGHVGSAEYSRSTMSDYAGGAFSGTYAPQNALAYAGQPQQPQNALAFEWNTSQLDPAAFRWERNALARQPITFGGTYGA